MYQSDAGQGCSCLCHNYPNNLAGCMDCTCKPIYSLKSYIPQTQEDIILGKLHLLETILNNLSDNISKLVEHSDAVKCPVCSGYNDWHHIEL